MVFSLSAGAVSPSWDVSFDGIVWRRVKATSVHLFVRTFFVRTLMRVFVMGGGGRWRGLRLGDGG